MEQKTFTTQFVERKSKLAALKKLGIGKREVTGSNKTSGSSKHTKPASGNQRRMITKPHMVHTAKTKLSRKRYRKMSAQTCSSRQREDDSFRKEKGKATEVSNKQTLSPAKTINSRRVLLHPKGIPPLSKLRSLVLSERSRNDHDIDGIRWPEGQLLWGKVRGYPFWPCMVSKDAFSKLFTKAVGSIKISRSYHVQFFGKEKQHSWINEASLLEFEGRSKYLDIVQYGLDNPQTNSKPPSEFMISTAWFPLWILAVTEAEASSKLDLQQRKLQYTFEYVVARSEAQMPVDELLKKVVSYKSGGRRGDDDRSDSDDDGLYNKLVDAQRERVCYDSDDVYSSDESSSCTQDKPHKHSVKVQVRQGLLQVFINKHHRFLQERHPDWQPDFVTEYLKKQWSVKTNFERSQYITRNQKPLFVEMYRSQRCVSSKVDNLPTVDPLTLDLQVEKLSRKWHIPRSDKSCLVCQLPGLHLVCCKGACARFFHAACVQDIRDNTSLCLDCHLNATVCFVCKQPGIDMVQCSSMKCQKYYHEVCGGQLPLTVMDKAGFMCPLHICATCHVEGRPGAREGSFVECLRCPTAYHCSDWCLVAGTQLMGKHHMVCADHFQPSRGCSQHSMAHVKCCLTCGFGGSLRQCQQCPAAFHEECDGISSVNPRRFNFNPDCGTSPAGMEVWLCSHCLSRRKLLYGDIVWVKHGIYRWWPAEICHPQFVPEPVQVSRHQLGEFPVRFFGSNDFAWLHQGRVLSFDRGITGLMGGAKNVKDQVFIDALRQATAAARFCASFDRGHHQMRTTRMM